jgi:hypothetical protein
MTLTWGEIAIIIVLSWLLIGAAHGSLTIAEHTEEKVACATSSTCPPTSR